MSRIFFDTEFIENGKTIDLLSIGLVREDGAEYYAECREADHSRASQWVRENVLLHLSGSTKPRAKIALEIVEFSGIKPEFWAYYCSYDWVALCQLFGTMMELPKDWPMFCMDVKQLAQSIGNPRLSIDKGTEHNALADARWTKQAWLWLQNRDKSA